MKIDIITLFPKMFGEVFGESIIKRAIDNNLVEINFVDLREFGLGKHRQVDARPFGGGAGMLLMVEPIYEALKSINPKYEILSSKQKRNSKSSNTRIILLSPQGKVFNQKKAKELSKKKHLILIAGRYEGFDQRIRDHLVDEEISIGNYVLTGGELPAMVVTEAAVRLIPNVIDKESLKDESFNEAQSSKFKIQNYKEYPQYTKPREFRGWKVPEVLLSGDHAKIDKWRKGKS